MCDRFVDSRVGSDGTITRYKITAELTEQASEQL
jgi:hypothetical protein